MLPGFHSIQNALLVLLGKIAEPIEPAPQSFASVRRQIAVLRVVFQRSLALIKRNPLELTKPLPTMACRRLRCRRRSLIQRLVRALFVMAILVLAILILPIFITAILVTAVLVTAVLRRLVLPAAIVSLLLPLLAPLLIPLLSPLLMGTLCKQRRHQQDTACHRQTGIYNSLHLSPLSRPDYR